MGTPDRYKSIIGQYFEKLNAFDPTLLEVFADRLRYIVPGNMPVSGTYHGKDEVMAMWLRFFERLEFIKVHPQEMIAEGTTVVVRAKGEARTKSGHDYNNLYVFFFRFEGDKIVEMIEFLDTAYAETVAFGSKLIRAE
jgi:ketosteroid isomerase-like protein